MDTSLGKVLHGSKLYRLDNPLSDEDHKGLFLPSLRDCALCRASHNQQNKTGEGADKIEYERFSIQEFLKFAANGEDVAITMLAAKDEDVLEDSEIYRFLRESRKSFYTKRLRGMAGYSKGMCLKYGYRADRMVVVEKVIAALEVARDKGVARLYQCWDDLPDGEHIVRSISENSRDGLDKRLYEVAGKSLTATISPQYALEILCKLRDGYGARVRATKERGGKDLKAISHSFRVGYQLQHIFQDGDFSFPLPETDFIRAVKEGKLNFVEDKLDEKLNDLITFVERLSDESNYPEKVDANWLDGIVLGAYGLK